MSKQVALAEVNKHNTKESIWIIIRNEVYDVTSFLGEHPGGEDALMEVAGQDATENFDNVGHSENARNILEKFKIGTLLTGEQTQSSNATN